MNFKYKNHNLYCVKFDTWERNNNLGSYFIVQTLTLCLEPLNLAFDWNCGVIHYSKSGYVRFSPTPTHLNKTTYVTYSTHIYYWIRNVITQLPKRRVKCKIKLVLSKAILTFKSVLTKILDIIILNFLYWSRWRTFNTTGI